MSNDARRATVGLSISPSLLALIDAHLAEIKEKDRSAYFKRLANADLAAAGKLPGTPAHDIRALALAAAEATSDEQTIKVLNALIDGGGETAATKLA